MNIEAKFKDKHGNITIEGVIQQQEVSFLLQYAINVLMGQGVKFELDDEGEEEQQSVKMKFPTND